MGVQTDQTRKYGQREKDSAGSNSETEKGKERKWGYEKRLGNKAAERVEWIAGGFCEFDQER